MNNLARILVEAAEKAPHKIAILFQSPRSHDSSSEEHHPAFSSELSGLTYSNLLQSVHYACGAFESLGVGPGDCVALLLYNEISFVIGYFALLSMGVTILPLNTRLTGEELCTILEDAEARWLLTQDDFLSVARGFSKEKLPQLEGILWQGGGMTSEVLENHRALQPDFQHLGFEALLAHHYQCSSPFPVQVNPESDVAVLIYTSGTTGKPKGVMLTHQSLLADTTSNAQVIEATPQDRFITISPLFHVFGQVNILLTALFVQGSVVLVKKFSPRSVLDAIHTYKVTFMAAVPTMYLMMLSYLENDGHTLGEDSQEKTISELKKSEANIRERLHPYDFSALRVCHSGAAPMAKEIFKRVESAFGAPVQEGYGLSEASSIVTSNPLLGVRKPGSVGKAIPGVTLCVMDEAMTPLPPGEVGEVHVKGPILMKGYYKRPEETVKSLVKGWLKTKDMGYLDEDGYLHIIDRKDDLMNVGGVKVYPREVEEVIFQHPFVQAVAVIGTPSVLYHEEIKAFVVLRPNKELNKSELQKFCREHLAEYKVPKLIEWVDEIPQGATGKILRKELRVTSSHTASC
ncbi:MAG: AMP-binding protein [Cyanobacteria bacterium]|nr:AMP-binding protein [Cyanobacteriota bacterium]